MIETGHDPWPQQGMLSLKCKDDCIKENQSYFFKKQASIWSFYRSFYFCEIFDHFTKLLVFVNYDIDFWPLRQRWEWSQTQEPWSEVTGGNPAWWVLSSCFVKFLGYTWMSMWDICHLHQFCYRIKLYFRILGTMKYIIWCWFIPIRPDTVTKKIKRILFIYSRNSSSELCTASIWL